MATPLEALSFREMFGRTMRRPESGLAQARFITPTPEDGPDSREFNALARAIQRQIVSILDDGEIFYVSRDITELLLQAARALDHKHVFHFEPDDFPALAGYVYFDGLIPLPTMMGEPARDKTWPTHSMILDGAEWEVQMQPLRAVLWGQLTKGDESGVPPPPGAPIVGKAMYSVVDAQPTERLALATRWCMRHWLPVEYGVRHTPESIMSQVNTWDEKHIHERLPADFREANDQVSFDSIDIIWRVLYAWMQFMRTELISRHQFDGAGPHNKIMVREGRPPARIRIITLRHYADGPTQNPTEVNWQYRWIQRGHWRNQRVGPGRLMIRPTWIRESVKGPADKPLHVPDATIQAYVR